MGKVFRLHLRFEPFAVLFWALGIVLAHILQQMTQPAGLPSLNHGRLRQWKDRFNLREEALAPSLFPSSYIIYLWMKLYSRWGLLRFLLTKPGGNCERDFLEIIW